MSVYGDTTDVRKKFASFELVYERKRVASSPNLGSCAQTCNVHADIWHILTQLLVVLVDSEWLVHVTIEFGGSVFRAPSPLRI